MVDISYGGTIIAITFWGWLVSERPGTPPPVPPSSTPPPPTPPTTPPGTPPGTPPPTPPTPPSDGNKFDKLYMMIYVTLPLFLFNSGVSETVGRWLRKLIEI